MDINGVAVPGPFELPGADAKVLVKPKVGPTTSPVKPPTVPTTTTPPKPVETPVS